MSTRREALLVAFLLVLGAWFHLYAKDKAVDQYKQERDTQDLIAITRTERASVALEASTRKELERKDEKINRISAERDAALERLRNRPSRPNNDSPSKDRRACRGTELYREDAEFLTREAARAERVREERDFYWQQYENARVKLGELNGK